MASSVGEDRLFGTLCMQAHSPRAETAGLPYADREDAAQDALLVLLLRCRRLAPMAQGRALCGVLRNVARNARRRLARARARENLGEQDLEQLPASDVNVLQDFVEGLSEGD